MATKDISGTRGSAGLALWHGLNLPLLLSLLSLLLGTWFYIDRHAWPSRLKFFGWLFGTLPQRGYELSLASLNRVALWQTNLLQSGYLRYYVMIVFIATTAIVGGTLALRSPELVRAQLAGVYFYEAGLVGLIIAAAFGSVVLGSRLASIAALGVVGYSVALVFVLYGAPDVAMTQFLVETLMVILFVLVFYHLSEGPSLSSRPARLRDALLAIAVGVLMTSLVLMANTMPHLEPISDYYNRYSVPAAHGQNVVNVILVDFRGLDTLGEITVLAVAGIGVYALLKLRPRGPNGNGISPASGGQTSAPHAAGQPKEIAE